jgi:hypothetical protein
MLGCQQERGSRLAQRINNTGDTQMGLDIIEHDQRLFARQQASSFVGEICRVVACRRKSLWMKTGQCLPQDRNWVGHALTEDNRDAIRELGVFVETAHSFGGNG